MTLMVVAHPIPGFNGRVFADEVAMAFVGGFAVANVPTGVQADLTARGFTLNATPGTNYGGKYVLEEDLADPDSQASASLRAAFGPSQFDTNEGASLARTNRIGQPQTQLPAITWTASNPTGMDHYSTLVDGGGGTPILNSSPPVRFVNATPANLQINTSFWTIKNVSNGSATPGPLAVEATVSGAAQVVLNLDPLANGNVLVGGGYVELWIDDIPVIVPPGPANPAHNPENLVLTWPSTGTHTIRLSLVLVSLNDMWVTPGGTLAPSAAPGGPRLLVQGDSWIEGALNISTTLARLLARYLGVDEAAVCGQGGTGYMHGTTTPEPSQGKSVYGSTDRLAAIVANNPTDIVVLGSINDDAETPSAVQTAAAAHYAYLATHLPSARVFVVLPQPANHGSAVSTTHIANREAVRTAASGASNVTAIVDATDWLTGTGYATQRTGDGNRDLYLGSDATHPTLAGHHYFARRLAEVLSRWLYI